MRGRTVSTVPQTIQQDWNVICECFDRPYSLLFTTNSMSKIMSEVVFSNAVSEMRRHYSRKVIDVLVKITRQSINVLWKKFSPDFDRGV